MATEMRTPGPADSTIPEHRRSRPRAKEPMKDRRQMLGGLYLLLAAVNLARGALAFKLVPVFASWPLALPLPFLGGVYLSCGLLFLAILALIAWRFDAHTRRYARMSGLLYQVVIWLIHIVGDRSTYARLHWWQDALMTASFLAIILWLTAPPERQRVKTEQR